MAISCSPCNNKALIVDLKHASASTVRGPRNKRLLMMCSNISPVSVNVRIRTSDLIKNKIFEDRSTGIVCYKDENGEITCEGYDEGPRLHHQISRFPYSSRDVEIIDHLQRCLLHVAEEGI